MAYLAKEVLSVSISESFGTHAMTMMIGFPKPFTSLFRFLLRILFKSLFCLLSLCPSVHPFYLCPSSTSLSLLSIISLCRHLIIRFTSLHTVSLSLSISHSIPFLALSFFLIRPLKVFRSRRRRRHRRSRRPIVFNRT